MSIREDYLNQGYVVIPNGLSEAPLSVLEDSVTNLPARVDLRTDVHFLKGQVSSIHNLHNYLREYSACFDTLRPIAQELLGEPLAGLPFNSSYFAKPPGGWATRDHQDNAYFHFEPPQALTCWVGLDDSDMTNGGLFYYEGSHQRGMFRHETAGNPGASQALAEICDIPEECLIRFLKLKRGDVVIHHPLVVHGSLTNHSEKPRRAFNFSFAGVSAKRNEATFQKYRRELDEFIVKKRREAVHG